MEKIKQRHPKPNWLGYIKWQKLTEIVIISCCDCGLAHTFQFRKTKNGKIEWRSKRNKELTKQNRKYDK